MRFNGEPTHEDRVAWPEIVLSDDPIVRSRLQRKIEQYQRRFYSGTTLKTVGQILHQDFHQREASGLFRTDAYLKMIYAVAVLEEGSDGRCDTALLHSEFYEKPVWAAEFLSIQLHDPHKFDELSWNAAEVVKEYASGAVVPHSNDYNQNL